jgi:FAD dependent oxidoreductase
MTAIEDDWIEVTCSGLETSSETKSLDPGLPRPNPTKSSWLIPPDPLQKFRSSESLPSGILDVVIIGSGFSGTSVAWHLLNGDDVPRQKLDTLMLEARDVCSGATGRNGTDLDLFLG